MNRKLTKQEKKWLIYGLKTLETGEYRGGGKWIDGKTGKIKSLDEPKSAELFLRQIDEIRVVRKCDCGQPECYTIKFQNYEPRKCGVMIETVTEDGRIMLIDVHNETQIPAGLEII